MDAKTIWLFVFVGLYWTYCLFWGIKGALVSRTATDYMIAGRRLGVWVFVLAATATSFSGWTFIGHPGSIYDYRLQYHSFLREHAGLGNRKRRLVPIAWAVTLLWFMLAIGPGAVIGNRIFGDPNHPDTWWFDISSLWTWQLLFWLLGVGLMWFLAFKMELSTVPEREIEELIGTPGHLRLVGR